VVLTRIEKQAEAFDQQVAYRIHRAPLKRRGPKGFEWLGMVWEFILVGIRVAKEQQPGFNPMLLQQVRLEYALRLRERLGGQPILLTVGRMQRRKGQDQIIRALPTILRAFPETKYVIVGPLRGWPPDFVETLRSLAEELGVSQHVLITGEVSKEDLPLYYLACDVFVMPNRLIPPGDVEGFGIVFLEASFLGKPVIGGQSGGVPDAV
jgi:glycosyltransferase involved in cell wall biosynthesis